MSVSTEQLERLNKLSPAKRAQLVKAMRERAARGEQSRGITRRAAGGASPLSFAQQRLWFLDQLEPGSAFYNLPAAVRLVGAFDFAALEQTITEIVRGHETLRTTFATHDQQPVQLVAPVLVLEVPLADLEKLPADK